MFTTTASIQVRKLLTVLMAQSEFIGAQIAECTCQGATVKVRLCCVGHAMHMIPLLTRVGLKVIRGDGFFRVRFPTETDKLSMQ